MTGKSTFLDGLRLYTGAALPEREAVRKQVEERGGNFLAGSAVVAFDCPGSDPTAPTSDKWPAQFFTQNELQQLAQNHSAVEDILAKLDGAEAAQIAERRSRLSDQDTALAELVTSLNRLDEQLGEAEQAEARARNAREALEAFREAGVEEFHRISRAHQNWRGAVNEASDLVRQVDQVAAAADSFVFPESNEEGEGSGPEGSGSVPEPAAPRAAWIALGEQLEAVQREARRWAEEDESLHRTAGRPEERGEDAG